MKTDTETEKAIYYISRGFVILAIFQFIAFFRAYSRVSIMQASLLNYFEENFSDFPITMFLLNFYSDFHKICYVIMQCTKINLREMCSPTLLRLDGIGLALINGRSQKNIQYTIPSKYNYIRYIYLLLRKNLLRITGIKQFHLLSMPYHQHSKLLWTQTKICHTCNFIGPLRHKQIGNVAMLWVIYHLGLPVLFNDNHFPLIELNISTPVRVNINIIKLRRYNLLTQ